MPDKKKYEIEFAAPVNLLAMMSDKERPKEFQISYKTTRSKEAVDVVICILGFARDVSVVVLAECFCEFIKKHSRGKSKKMTIDRKTIEIEKGKIKKIIEEHITDEEN